MTTGFTEKVQKRHFNSHAHVERDVREVKTMKINVNFNSHAHVERDDFDLEKSESWIISTHTLTWSVTEIYGS